MNTLHKTLSTSLFLIFFVLSTAQDKLIIKGSDTLGAKMIPKMHSLVRQDVAKVPYSDV